jgi:hypothetical protein
MIAGSKASASTFTKQFLAVRAAVCESQPTKVCVQQPTETTDRSDHAKPISL